MRYSKSGIKNQLFYSEWGWHCLVSRWFSVVSVAQRNTAKSEKKALHHREARNQGKRSKNVKNKAIISKLSCFLCHSFLK